MTRSTRSTLRQAVLAFGIVAVALTAGMALGGPAEQGQRQDAWLANLKGKHRQLFDTPATGGGIPLVHVMNYLDTYNKAFNVPDRDINTVLTFYGSTTFHGLSDDMWAKYRLGEFLGEKDAQGTPMTKNPWRAAPQIMGMAMAPASIEALQKRGTTFIICNNALGIFAGLVAQARGLEQAAVFEDMKAHILPGVTLVPAMVIAIEQAQNAGITYHRQ
jgi:intracellular sulfur oxidation DsrE/DsrF family protein